MTGRRWFWLVGVLCNAAGIWRWFTQPGIEVLWLIIWGVCFAVTLEAVISNRSLTGERKK